MADDLDWLHGVFDAADADARAIVALHNTAPELLAVVSAAADVAATCKRVAPWQPYLALTRLHEAIDALRAKLRALREGT